MNNNNDRKNTGFELNQEQIDTIKKATSYLETIVNFAGWCT